MLKDCKSKKIDVIYTKSVSRFSRNTLDFLKVIRKLKQLDVDVYFQNEQIWLKKERGEFNMTAHVAVAQEESMSRNRCIRKALEYRFQSGTSKTANRICYGYKQNMEGKLIVDKEKAENVRLIFDLYLKGYSLSGIAKELKKRGIVSPTGKETWTSVAIDKLLSNEKYIGQVLLQKTYIENVLEGKQIKNRGEVTRYLYENNHTGIIAKETFKKVQLGKAKRSNIAFNDKGKQIRKSIRYSSGDTLSGKIKCGNVDVILDE